MPCAEARHFVQTTQHALDDLNEFPTHHLRLRLADSYIGEYDNRTSTSQECVYSTADEAVKQGKGPSLSLHLKPDSKRQSPKLETGQYSANADLSYAPNQLPTLPSSSSSLTTYIATELHSLFLEEQASIAYILASQDNLPNASQSQRLLKSLPRLLVDSVAHRSTHSLKYASTYHLTFSLFSAGSAPSSWDISEALRDHIQPWLTALSSTYNFSVNTQVQLYASLSPSVRPKHDDTSNTTTLEYDDLSAFVNAAEWPLSPSLGSPSGPTINFILYVPTASQVPLSIANTGGKTSWIIPHWGGISILNPPTTLSTETRAPALPSHLSSLVLSSAFETFTSQLLTLLSIPPPISSSPAGLPLPLRLQQVLHTRLLSTYLSTLSTLGSLSRLTASQPQIPIPRTVSSSVALSLSHLQSACTAMQDSRFADAMRSVNVAETEAEKAFFEKSMVGQVYFPDEHKVAVYLPLMGPVGVPLVVAVVKELRGIIKAWRERRRKR